LSRAKELIKGKIVASADSHASVSMQTRDQPIRLFGADTDIFAELNQIEVSIMYIKTLKSKQGIAHN